MAAPGAETPLVACIPRGSLGSGSYALPSDEWPLYAQGPRRLEHRICVQQALIYGCYVLPYDDAVLVWVPEDVAPTWPPNASIIGAYFDVARAAAVHMKATAPRTEAEAALRAAQQKLAELCPANAGLKVPSGAPALVYQ